ncbi:MAG TPA: TolC family protein [Anaeromyxobacter sp.]|nr:TolC family protein [Anaeromyxobacter sp.]
MRSTPVLCGLLLATATRAQDPAPLASVDFDEAVRLASQRSVPVEVAAEEVNRTEALLAETRASALPLVSANGTWTRIDHARTATALVPASPTPPPWEVRPATVVAVPQIIENGNLAVSVPLLAPSRWYQWSHAADQAGIARASEIDVRRQVAIVAARAYLTIIAQKRLIDVSQRAVANAAAHYDYAHVRHLGGIGNALDEARADQQLATSQAQFENAVAGLVRAQEALAIAVGSPTPLDARAEPDLGGGPTSPEEGISSAEEGRTDILLARERSAAAHRVAADSWADWMPTLSLNALAYLQDPATSTTPNRGWQAQLVLSFPLYEGGLRRGQQGERDALEAEARIVLQGTLDQARSDVRSAYSNLDHALAALEQTRRAADRARTALTIVEEAFKAGATTSLDVTDAERTARDADSAAVIAEDAVRQSRLDLLSAVGRFPGP